MDLCEPGKSTMVAFCVKIAERATADHYGGIKKRPTGYELCQEYAEGYRGLHARLASTIYAKVRHSFEAFEKEQVQP
jgi:hypothetical protein